MTGNSVSYRPEDLRDFASSLLRASGLAPDRAAVVADRLVEGDLLGHTTHGLALLAGYLAQIENGLMTVEGEPEVVTDRGAVALWDGRRLPGLWLADRAVATACERARRFGLSAVSIRNSHHIGCLAAFLEAPAREGLMIVIASSDPSVAAVAPFGGTAPVMTPNPFAVGIPTEGEPILIDISASITTMGMAARLRQAGERLPGPWLVDAQGRATDDPHVLTGPDTGALLPIGGLDHGHKGYALGLFIEALTQGVSAFGRADPQVGQGASVWIQVIDPELFGGAAGFARQTQWLAKACRDNRVPPGKPPVRLPGESGLARKRKALTEGIKLHPTIIPALTPWSDKLKIALPRPVR